MCQPDWVTTRDARDAAAEGRRRPGALRATWIRRFVYQYRWRAFALPVLSVLTVALPDHPTRAGESQDARGAIGATRLGAGAGEGPAAAPLPPVYISLASDGTPCASELRAATVVSITKQRAWMCQAGVQVYSTLVTTGAVHVGDGHR